MPISPFSSTIPCRLKTLLQDPLRSLYIQCPFLYFSQLLCKFCNWIYSLLRECSGVLDMHKGTPDPSTC